MFLENRTDYRKDIVLRNTSFDNYNCSLIHIKTPVFIPLSFDMTTNIKQIEMFWCVKLSSVPSIFRIFSIYLIHFDKN